MSPDRFVGATVRLESGVRAKVLERIEDEHGVVYLVQVAADSRPTSILTVKANEMRSLAFVGDSTKGRE